jgi:hypothetical protein
MGESSVLDEFGGDYNAAVPVLVAEVCWERL